MEKHTAIKVYKGLGEDICRSTLLEYIFQKDSPLYRKDGYKTGGNLYTVPYTEMEVDELSEGCRHWLNRGWTDRATGEHPAGEVFDDYRDFHRESMITEAAKRGSENPRDAYTKKQLETINYGEYTHYAREDDLDPTVTVGRNSIEVSDIINGQLIRRRYIDYTEDEALESFIEDITTGGI